MAHINCIAFLVALRAQRLRSRVIRAMVLPPKAEIRAPPCSSRLFDDGRLPWCSWALSSLPWTFLLCTCLFCLNSPFSFLSLFLFLRDGDGGGLMKPRLSLICCVNKDDLEFLILLPRPPKCWNYRLFRQYFLVYEIVMLGITHKLSACSEIFPNPFRLPFPFSFFK